MRRLDPRRIRPDRTRSPKFHWIRAIHVTSQPRKRRKNAAHDASRGCSCSERIQLRRSERISALAQKPPGAQLFRTTVPRTQPWKSGPSRAAFQGRQERALARVDVFPATTPQWSLRPSALRLATRPLLENAQAEPRSGERLQPTTQVVGTRAVKESSSEGAKEALAQRRLQTIRYKPKPRSGGT